MLRPHQRKEQGTYVVDLQVWKNVYVDRILQLNLNFTYCVEKSDAFDKQFWNATYLNTLVSQLLATVRWFWDSGAGLTQN